MVSLDHPLVQTVCRYTSTGSACPDDIQLQPGSWLPLPRLPLPGVTIAACLGKPRAVGRLRFTSARADVAPVIETALLSDPRDLETAREALRWIGRLASTRAISSIARVVYPSRAFVEDGTFRGAVERITGSGYHPCGTAPMGAVSDPGSVVDSRGAVIGVRGLYVADASVMPTIPMANTNLATLMIGERMGSWLRLG
jgi:choline dehydrogenase